MRYWKSTLKLWNNNARKLWNKNVLDKTQTTSNCLREHFDGILPDSAHNSAYVMTQNFVGIHIFISDSIFDP